MFEKSPATLQEVIRDKKRKKVIYKYRSGNKSFPSYNHFYVKIIIIVIRLTSFLLKFFLN